MNSTTEKLLYLYAIIENADSRTLRGYLSHENININLILPCKGIGLLHLSVGIEPVEESLKCTKIIIEYGGDPNLCSEDGTTPVHIAAVWGRLENLKILLGSGGDPLFKDDAGRTAYDYAITQEQWDIYDYLNRIEDNGIDPFESNESVYTLELDKILIWNKDDEIVAEYSQLDCTEQTDTCRKSALTVEWCKKTSQALNKNLTKDSIVEIWKRQNEQSVKCMHSSLHLDDFSPKEALNIKLVNLQISGIAKIESTLDDEKRRNQFDRVSVYENFSLPGSPTNVIHMNYHSKSSLKRRNRTQRNLSSSFIKEDKTHSCHTSHCSCNNMTDDILALIENESNESRMTQDLEDSTEENLAIVCDIAKSTSSCNMLDFNHISQESPPINGTVWSIEEEYKYTDKEEKAVLIEKRLLPAVRISIDNLAAAEEESVHSFNSVASSLPASLSYDSDTLRLELTKCGFNPGPINNNTKHLYLKKLINLRKNPIATSTTGTKTYSAELEKTLRDHDWNKDLTSYVILERKATQDFSNPKHLRTWREGSAKTSFTYLLLDPRITDNLPANTNEPSAAEPWKIFLDSIFYIGKGKRSRPYSHLYQALNLWKHDLHKSNNKKVQQILDIWKEGVGVVCLHVFQNLIPAEAYTYEAAMIDTLRITNLTNIKPGSYYGCVSSWPVRERRQLGVLLLYKAMLIFINEGERQLRPEHID